MIKTVGGLLRQFEGDLFFQLVGEVEVAAAGTGADLHGHAGDLGIQGFDAHPDTALVHTAFDSFNTIGAAVDIGFGKQLAVAGDNGLGRIIDLVHGALILARDFVFEERRGGFFMSVHCANATHGEQCRSENRQKKFHFHIAISNHIPWRRQAWINNSWLNILLIAPMGG